MEIGLLGAMVVLGIAAIVVAVHLTGGSKPLRMASEDEARAAFLGDHSDVEIEAVYLSESGDAAILELAGGGVGVVQSFGHRFVTRLLTSEDLSEAVAGEGGRLSLRMREFGWRGGDFVLGERAAPRIAARLSDRRAQLEDQAVGDL